MSDVNEVLQYFHREDAAVSKAAAVLERLYTLIASSGAAHSVCNAARRKLGTRPKIWMHCVFFAHIGMFGDNDHLRQFSTESLARAFATRWITSDVIDRSVLMSSFISLWMPGYLHGFVMHFPAIMEVACEQGLFDLSAHCLSLLTLLMRTTDEIEAGKMCVHAVDALFDKPETFDGRFEAAYDDLLSAHDKLRFGKALLEPWFRWPDSLRCGWVTACVA